MHTLTIVKFSEAIKLGARAQFTKIISGKVCVCTYRIFQVSGENQNINVIKHMTHNSN